MRWPWGRLAPEPHSEPYGWGEHWTEAEKREAAADTMRTRAAVREDLERLAELEHHAHIAAARRAAELELARAAARSARSRSTPAGDRQADPAPDPAEARPEQTPSSGPVPDLWETQNRDQLREACRDRDLTVTGSPADLRARLRAHDAAAPARLAAVRT